MADDLSSKIPAWLKSLYEMENELRDAVRKGLILRNEKATEHLAGARRHLDEIIKEVRGEEPPNGPQTPLPKERCEGHGRSSVLEALSDLSVLQPKFIDLMRAQLRTSRYVYHACWIADAADCFFSCLSVRDCAMP